MVSNRPWPVLLFVLYFGCSGAVHKSSVQTDARSMSIPPKSAGFAVMYVEEGIAIPSEVDRMSERFEWTRISFKCSDWNEKFDVATVLFWRGQDSKVWKISIYRDAFESPSEPHERSSIVRVGKDYLLFHLITTVDSIYIEVNEAKDGDLPSGERARCTFESETEQLESMVGGFCGDIGAEYSPVILGVRQGERFAFGSGVYVENGKDSIILTVGHVGELSSSFTVYVNSANDPTSWTVAASDVPFRCRAGVCIGKPGKIHAPKVQAPNGQGLWALVSHIGEAPVWERPDGRVGCNVVRFEKTRHIHESASGSGIFVVKDGKITLLGVLSTVLKPSPDLVPKDTDEEFAIYVPICPKTVECINP